MDVEIDKLEINVPVAFGRSEALPDVLERFVTAVFHMGAAPVPVFTSN